MARAKGKISAGRREVSASCQLARERKGSGLVGYTMFSNGILPSWSQLITTDVKMASDCLKVVKDY